MITLTDTAATQGQGPHRGRGRRRTWRCASPCAPAAARASATRCSSTPTSPTTTSPLDYAGVQGRGRPVERPAARGRHARLQGRPPGRRVRHQQPERPAHLRLRPVLQLVGSAPAAYRPRPAPVTTTTSSRRERGRSCSRRASAIQRARLDQHERAGGTRRGPRPWPRPPRVGASSAAAPAQSPSSPRARRRGRRDRAPRRRRARPTAPATVPGPAVERGHGAHGR